MSRHRSPSLKLLTIAVLAMLPAVTALAAPQSQREPRHRGSDEQKRGDDDNRSRRDSLSDAVRRVERDTRGEVLSAERVQFDGRDMHRVKVVDDQGRVRVFVQDPHRREDGDLGPRGNNHSRSSRRSSTPTHDDDD